MHFHIPDGSYAPLVPVGALLISMMDVERSDVDTRTDGEVYGSAERSIRWTATRVGALSACWTTVWVETSEC